MKNQLRGFALLFVCSLVFAPALRADADRADPADKHNQQRGFQSDKVYAVGDIDSVNAYNGNLILRIPLGPEYSAGPILKYQFTLVYNSKIWDYQTFLPNEPNTGASADVRGAVPEHFSNAGLGWNLTLGRVFPPNADTLHEWLYVAPDGSTHEFDWQTNLTTDGSYLRRSEIVDRVRIEFPDGAVHTFHRDTGLLDQITDPFGNWVKVRYEGSTWIVEDGTGDDVARSHTIRFTDLTSEFTDIENDDLHHYGGNKLRPNLQRVVSSVELAGPNNTTSTFTLTPVVTTVGRGGAGARTYNVPRRCVMVPLLERIQMPDGAAYDPEYNTVVSGDVCNPLQPDGTPADLRWDGVPMKPQSGVIASLTLPTKGKIEWTHGIYTLNTSMCPQYTPFRPVGGAKIPTQYVGVKERKVDNGIDPPAIWTYASSLNTPTFRRQAQCFYKISGEPTGPPEPDILIPPDELTNVITAPDGVKTINYFSAYPQDGDELGTLMKGYEYGLPFTRNQSINDEDGNPLYLSSEVKAGTTTLKKTYLRYEYEFIPHADTIAKNSRVAAERTIYPQDTGCGANQSEACYTEVRRSHFDYFGHYRKSVTSSNYPNSVAQTTFTNYTPHASKWFLGVYGTSWQQVGSGPKVGVTKAEFDLDKGVVKTQRVYAGPQTALTEEEPNNLQASSTDLLTAVCREGRGFVSSERSFGGDTGSIPSSDPCDAPDPLPADGNYFTEHLYTFSGVALTGHKVQDSERKFFTLDETYDANTGLVTSSRDSAGVETRFQYDSLFRLERVFPPGTAEVSYIYDRSATSPRASVKVTTHEQTSPKEDWYYFDGLGAPILAKTQVASDAAGDHWSTTVTRYDANGRVSSVSMPILRDIASFENLSPAHVTANSYDAFGRVTKLTQPDGSEHHTDFHNGTRLRTFSSKAAGEAPKFKSSELYDGRGRLVTVMEKSGDTNASRATGDDVETHYTYDFADRLLDVNTSYDSFEQATQLSQARHFVYDSRGFLVSEQHPEKGSAGNGIVGYSLYDARGHARRKNDGGVITEYSFDKGERLIAVKDGAGQELKTFEFAEENISLPGNTDYCEGKLRHAVRYNRLSGDRTIRVKESYAYTAPGGRVAGRDTAVHQWMNGTWTPIQTFSQTYEYEPDYGAIRTVGYPTCPGCSFGSALTSVIQSYSHGLLTGVDGFATLSYHANGMVATVKRNLPADFVDRYVADRGMSRPQSIQLASGSVCRAVYTWAQNVQINSGQTATFDLDVAPGATVQWYRGSSGDVFSGVVHEGDSFTTPVLSETTRYWYRASLPNGCSIDSPTVTAEVCALPRIISPEADATVAIPVDDDDVDDEHENDDVEDVIHAEVTAVASGISYTWQLVRLNYNSEDRTFTEAESFPLPSGSRSVDWMPPTVSEGTQYWGLRVVITGTCSGAASITRMVKIVAVANRDVCATPSFIEKLPPERRVWWPSHTVNLDVAVAGNPNEHMFEWSVNGAVVLPFTEGHTGIGVSLHDLQPRTVAVRVYRKCGTAQSKTIQSSSYLYTDENCPTPTLIVDQSSVDVSNGKFTASSPWPSVHFQWYKGDSGNTQNPIESPAGIRDYYDPTEIGTYWVRAISKCKTTADSPTLIATNGSCTPVQFIRQPAADTSSHAGTEVTLSFETSAQPPVHTIHWYADGTLIPGETSDSLTVEPRKTTIYSATAESCTVGRSRNAVVHIYSCDDIDVQQGPQSASIDQGQSASLSIQATSPYPLTYQWYEGLSGDTSNPLEGEDEPLVIVWPQKTTTYWARVSVDALGGCAIDTVEVTVWVCRTPELLPGEQSEIVDPVPNVMHWLEADATGDNLSYTWYHGAVGDTSEVLSTGRSIVMRTQVTKQFWLRVTSDCVAPISDRNLDRQYRISICPEIVNEAHAEQTKVMPGTGATLSIETVRGDTIEWFRGTESIGFGSTILTLAINGTTTFWARVTSGACHVDSAPVTVSLCDQPTVGWNAAVERARISQQQTLSVQQTHSSEDVLFDFYKGTPGNIAQSTLLQSDAYTTLGVHPEVTTTYWVRAKEPGGCYDDTTGLTVDVCVPQIGAQPQNITINNGASAPLSVAVDLPASPRLTYQWYAGSPGDTAQPLAGKTQASIAVQPTVTTTYWVRVTSECSTGSPITVDSAAATVTVCVPPAITQQPTNVAGHASIAASVQVAATGTDLSYQWYRGASGDTANPINNATTASLSYTTSQTTDVWVKVTGHCGSLNSNTARISIAPTITTHPVGGSVTQGTTRNLTVVATGTYLTFQWYSGAGTASPINGATNASYTTPALNADASYWVRVTSGSWSADSNVATLTVCQPRTASITYSTKISGSPVTLQVNAPAGDETFQWYQGPSGTVTTPVSTGAYVSVSPLQTTDYWVRTIRATCNADSPTVTVRVCTPKINAQPQSGSALNGSTVSLNVSATGTGPLAYQWYAGASGNTSQPVAGATSASFTTPPLTTSTSYWVRVTSPSQSGCTANSVDSQAAALTVCNVPSISSTTANQKTISGSSVTLSLTATGGNLQYEWHQGAVGSGPIVGTTSSISVAPSATTTYWVRVYNGCGTVNSSAIQVSIYPTITRQPADTTACANSTARISLTATGSGLSYQWHRQYSAQSAQIVGGNEPFVDVVASGPASVWCRVTSGEATTISNTVSLSTSPAPTIMTLTKTVHSPTQWKLTANVLSDDAPLVEYEWYRGALGDTSNRLNVPINSTLVVVTPPSLPMTYWVRVKYTATGCSTDRAITIQ